MGVLFAIKAGIDEVFTLLDAAEGLVGPKAMKVFASDPFLVISLDGGPLGPSVLVGEIVMSRMVRTE